MSSGSDTGSSSVATRATPAAAELLDLVHDLRNHLEWLQELYPTELIPADESWVAARREQYRTYKAFDGAGSTAQASDGQDTRTPPRAAPSVVSAPPAVEPPALVPAAPRVAAERIAPLPELPARAVPPPAPLVAREPVPAIAPAVPAGSLTVLQERVASCTRCGLSTTRTQTVFARGTTRSGIVFVGEGPGAEEDAQGVPFVGKAGQLLDRMIEAMGMSRDDVYVCNVVKCRPPDNRKPEEGEMAACRPFLTEQLELLQPKVIVALGATAVQGLLGLTMGITRLRGQWRLYRGQIPVMPTFHPAYLLRQPAAKREVWQDLQAVLEHLGLKPPKRGES